MTQTTHESPPDSPAVHERPTTVQAFSRLAGRVMPHAGRWLARWRVPVADRDDVLQETLLKLYERREFYDPERGPDVEWAYGVFGFVVRNFRRAKARRLRRVDVAPRENLLDVAVEAPNPEEEMDEAWKRRLLHKCLASLDTESQAILLARDVDGMDMKAIAVAHGVSLSTVYARYHEAREGLQKALDRELGKGKRRALGAAAILITLDQLLATGDEAAHISDVTARRMWAALDRVMGPDVAAGKLGDDGTEVQRYMGVALKAPRVGLLGRALRALCDPRVSHTLTSVVSAVVGAFVMYQLMKGSAEPPRTIETGAPEAAAASVALLLGPAPAPSATAVEAPNPPTGAAVAEQRVTAGAPRRGASADAPEPRPSVGPAASAVIRDDILSEQRFFERGSTLFQEGRYTEAIAIFQQHESEHPQGRFVTARDRLWTLALISAGRKPEARTRIEQLRRANPESQILSELDAAMRAAN